MKRRRSQRGKQSAQVIRKTGKADANASDSSSDDEEYKKHRATVLETTVHKAREMYEQLSILTSACYKQHDSIQQLRRQLKAVTAALHVATQPRRCDNCEHPLASVPADSSSILHSCIASSALTSSLLLACRVGTCVMDGSSGRLLDANDELLDFSGWQRSQLVDACQPVVGWPNVRSQVQLRRPVDDKSADNRGRVGLAADQYGRSWQRIWQLYTGELDKTDAVWRCCHAGGGIYEMSCSQHVASWEDEDGEEVPVSGMRRTPGRVVWIISIMDAKRVD